MPSPPPPKATCLKTTHLRREQNVENVKEWLRDPTHVYVGREQRVFVHWRRPLCDDDTESLPDGAYLDKHGHVVERFVVAASMWHNPYKVDKRKPVDGELERVLRQYHAYLAERLQNEPALRTALRALGGTTLGCWCTDTSRCHTAVIIDLYTQYRCA